MATTTFIVTAITGAYVVNGTNDPELTMYRGQTYTFNINVSGHPLFIQTTTPYNPTNIYNNGVTGNGTQNGTLTFVVPLDAPNTLYYVCQFHPSMGNRINITDQPIPCYSKGTLILTNQGYIKVEDMPEGENPWLRENFQRNCISRGLLKAKDHDLIIVSDADEIPNPEKIINFDPKRKYGVFEQKHYYYKINLLNETNPIWRGSKACIKKYLKSPQWLRELKIKKRPFWRLDKINLNNYLYYSKPLILTLKRLYTQIISIKNTLFFSLIKKYWL